MSSDEEYAVGLTRQEEENKIFAQIMLKQIMAWAEKKPLVCETVFEDDNCPEFGF